MRAQGCDCTIVIKTAYREFDVPYSQETIREAVSLLQEEAAIEGNGACKAIRKKCGVTGCVVSPLTIGTAHLLIYLAMGAAGLPVYVSETRNVYKYCLKLLPMQDADSFDLIQDRQNERKFFEGCKVNSFELRFEREQAVRLKLDITGEKAAVVYPYTDVFAKESGERFFGDNVKYRINDREYSNIYGLTILSKKESGVKTEIWIRRSLEKSADIPDVIEELTITAILQKDKYEFRHFGQFRITIRRLVLVSDETNVSSSDAVIGPLRYYVCGCVSAEVFTSTGEKL
jgi:hypothetical protein